MQLIFCQAITAILSHCPYIPPYATDLAQSSPQAVKRSTAHSDPPRSKKKRSDRTETSNSWQAEKIEDSAAYKAQLKNCGNKHKNLL